MLYVVPGGDCKDHITEFERADVAPTAPLQKGIQTVSLEKPVTD